MISEEQWWLLSRNLIQERKSIHTVYTKAFQSEKQNILHRKTRLVPQGDKLHHSLHLINGHADSLNNCFMLIATKPRIGQYIR